MYMYSTCRQYLNALPTAYNYSAMYFIKLPSLSAFYSLSASLYYMYM